MSDGLSLQVELFAELMVGVDDPWSSREAVLAASALDEIRYRSLVDGWGARFERDAAGGLASRFAAEYAARRAARTAAREREASGEAPAEDARFLNADAQAFREEAARVAREPLAETAPPLVAGPRVEAARVVAPPAALFAGTTDIGDVVQALALGSLPFMAAPAAPPPPAPSAPALPRPSVGPGTVDVSGFVRRERTPSAVDKHLAAPVGPPVLARPDERFAGTADIGAFVPRAATPFAAPAALVAPEAGPPRRRLIRFDPQTGQPLPAPIWVDLPPEPPAPGAPKT